MTSAYRCIALDTVVSTNDEAMERLRAGDRGGLVVTARAQTGGRGRQGKPWASPPGNLYMSLALRDPATPALAPQLGFVAGVSLAKALRARLRGDARLKLKWPNDVLHDGAKLAGILLESAWLPDGALGCVIGIGINCRFHPGGLPYPATDLDAVGASDADPDSIRTDFTRQFDIQVREWDGGKGFAAVRAAWLEMAAGLGESIVVATPHRRFHGFFRDLDPTGRLLVDTADGRHAVEAGDVFLPTMTAAFNN